METATIVTSWVQGQKGRWWPSVALDYPGYERCQDVTGQDATAIPTDPNLVTVEFVAESALLDAIEADSAHLVLSRDPYVPEPLP